MLSVTYREVGQTEHKTFVAKKLTYVGEPGWFALYDTDDHIKEFIQPVSMVVKPIVNAPDD